LGTLHSADGFLNETPSISNLFFSWLILSNETVWMIFLLLLGQRMVMENFGKKTRHVECSRVPEFLPFLFSHIRLHLRWNCNPFPTCLLMKAIYGYCNHLMEINQAARGNEGNNRVEMKESGLTQFIVRSPSAVGSKRKWHAAYYYYLGPKDRILIPCGLMRWGREYYAHRT
jgi:hypothetical protein